MIDLVNSVITLFGCLTFLLGSLTVTLTVPLFWISVFLLTLVFVLQRISIHWEILTMLLSQFSLTIHQTQRDSLFQCTTYDYSRADWDGLHDHLRDMPWEDIFQLGILLLLILQVHPG